MINALIVGGGGREHTLAWKLNQSDSIDTVYCAPGNPGMDDVVSVDISDFNALADFALSHNVGLTIAGPEAPLCAGIVDVFRRRDLAIFGPDKASAQLEGSKRFAKDFMVKYGIPTAIARSFTELEPALAYIDEVGVPIVVKADGLAAGKGVTVALTRDDAISAVRACFDGLFGEAGAEVVIEECLVGEEASILAFVDGKTIKPLASSQDHKPIGDGDTGPNTGGMGAYSPAPVVDDALWSQIDEQVLQPFLRGIQQEGLDYRGIIYAGIMVTAQGLEVLEFNVRFGDPETQAILPRMTSDLAEAMLACIEQRLDTYDFSWSDDAAVCVVLASGGYPGAYETGKVISGCEEAAATGALVFHAGTKRANGQLVTAGGRVLGVTALGPDIRGAVARAYEAANKIHWEGVYKRRDIAHRALDRL